MSLINQKNFFKNTYCEFKEINLNHIEGKRLQFHSASNSKYYYTEQGVYRHANHWGRVANCRWRLKTESKFKNQEYYLGYAKWSDFVHQTDPKKRFTITVDYTAKEVILCDTIHHSNNEMLFSISEAQNREKDIIKLLHEERWSKYFTGNIDELRKEIIAKYLSTNRKLKDIKRDFL